MYYLFDRNFNKGCCVKRDRISHTFWQNRAQLLHPSFYGFSRFDRIGTRSKLNPSHRGLFTIFSIAEGIGLRTKFNTSNITQYNFGTITVCP